MFSFPSVKQDQNQKIYILFYYENKRYRLYSGNKFNIRLNPNNFPLKERLNMGHILAGEIYKLLSSGKGPTYEPETIPKTDLFYLKSALDSKLNEPHSLHHYKGLTYAYSFITKNIKSGKIDSAHVKLRFDSILNNTTYNTIRRNLLLLFSKAAELGMPNNPMSSIKPKRAQAKLNRSYQNIPEILEEIKSFDHSLYLCCLFTYGCLLRPHREIRELKWGDFSSDLKHIHLSGSRNKSGRNRIVPVPEFIRVLLEPGQKDHNIFSGTIQPYNADYFKTVWGRFKKTSKLLEEGQTLYSFRHSGAIDIFQRTGSIVKLKQAMGHSSINVSLTYLRGLEVAELTEEDMPLLG